MVCMGENTTSGAYLFSCRAAVGSSGPVGEQIFVRQIRQHVQLTLVANNHGQVEVGGGFVTGVDEGFERAQQGMRCSG